jgi:hypothetical protein
MLPTPNPNPSSSALPTPPVADENEYVDPGARAIDLKNRPVADSLREIMASSPRLPQQLPPPLPPVAPTFANRHWTLAVVGLFALVGAMVLAGETVWHLTTGGLHALAQDPAERARLLVANPVSIVFHLVLGLGLILARRWARQLSLAFILEALLWGLVSATAIAVNNFPDFTRPLSAEDHVPAWGYLTLLGGVAAISWLLLSLLSHRNVRLTCTSAQPAPDWTDTRSPSELLLFALMISTATTWAGLAGYHAWPCWGGWRFDHIAWVWGGSAALAAVAASLTARGSAAGPCLAISLVVTAASSVAVTALHRPSDEARLSRFWGAWDDFSQVWDDWDFNVRGGLTFTALMAVVTVAAAVAALRSQAQRRKASIATVKP